MPSINSSVCDQVEYADVEGGENYQVPGCDGRLLVVTGRPVAMTDATVDGATF
jgi:hypothetical protein